MSRQSSQDKYRHKEKVDRQIYSVCFNHIHPNLNRHFAVAGENLVSIYRMGHDYKFNMVQEYKDDEPEEQFYTCAWTMGSEDGHPLIVAAGEQQVLKVIDCTSKELVHCFVGHGGMVNEVKAHPEKPQLLLSASKDESIRLWNLATKTCVMIFAGLRAHRGDVLSVDFHQTKERFASCGMDNTVKIWDLEDQQHVIAKSQAWKKSPSAFAARTVQFPHYSTNRVHNHYVDCVQWYGDLILSKSFDESEEQSIDIVMWKPVPGEGGLSDSIIPIKHFEVEACSVWFIKFALAPTYDKLAVGNCKGAVSIFDLEVDKERVQPRARKRISWGYKQPVSQIRHVSFSADGSYLVCCSQESNGGTLCSWHLDPPGEDR